MSLPIHNVQEEEYLLLEARKIEANAQRLLRARDEAIHLLAKVDSMLYTKSVPAHAGGSNAGGGGGGGSAVGADGSTISVSNVGGLKVRSSHSKGGRAGGSSCGVGMGKQYYRKRRRGCKRSWWWPMPVRQQQRRRGPPCGV